MPVEEGTDGTTDALLDLVVRIDKRHADLACQLFADGGLATAGHADERDDERGQTSPRSWLSSGWRTKPPCHKGSAGMEALLQTGSLTADIE